MAYGLFPRSFFGALNGWPMGEDGCLICLFEVSEWVSERVGGWVSEWVGEWVSEWVYDSKPWSPTLQTPSNDPGTLERGAGRGEASLLPFLKGARGSELPFLNCFLSILATVFQPGNTTEGTLCSKLTDAHLIALLPYQYKASA